MVKYKILLPKTLLLMPLGVSEPFPPTRDTQNDQACAREFRERIEGMLWLGWDRVEIEQLLSHCLYSGLKKEML